VLPFAELLAAIIAVITLCHRLRASARIKPAILPLWLCHQTTRCVMYIERWNRERERGRAVNFGYMWRIRAWCDLSTTKGRRCMGSMENSLCWVLCSGVEWIHLLPTATKPNFFTKYSKGDFNFSTRRGQPSRINGNQQVQCMMDLTVAPKLMSQWMEDA
jgi:hypothetical protein